MSHHMQFSASYTWSHALDNGVNGTTFSDTNDFLDPFNINRDYGNSSTNVPNRFVFNGILDSPWRLGGLVGPLPHHCDLSSVYQVQKRLPYSAVSSANSPRPPLGLIHARGRPPPPSFSP